MTVTIKVRADFPVREGESFVVHDTDGKYRRGLSEKTLP